MNEFNESLANLSDGIDRIFSGQIIQKKYWLQLSVLVYDHCQSRASTDGQRILFKTATGRQKHLLTVGIYGRHHYSGSELYYRIEKYLINYVKNLCEIGDNMSDEDLLQFYVDQWNKYRSSSKLLHHVFSYLHRYWMQIVHNSGCTCVYEIFTLSMLIWQEIFLKPIGDRLTNICFNMIENERINHVTTNIHLIRDVIDSYKAFHFDIDMLLWFDDEPTAIPAVNIYKELFEIPFLEDTKRFYRIEANKHFNESAIGYLTKVGRYLNEEEHRIYSYLRLSSAQSFLTMIEEILIQDYLNNICDEVRNMLNQGNYEDFKCLFETIKQMIITKNKLKTILEDHIYQIGYQSIEQISAETIPDPKIYIKTIVQTYEKLSQMMQDIFLNDFIFVDAFNKACVRFINTNVMTDTGKNSSQLLAEYCNKLLQNKNKIVQESELEKTVDDIMIVFNYMEDKDAFELFYRQLLTKRLINQQSISNDYEEMIILKLKQLCGWTYSSKLENMLQDMTLSKDLMDKYQASCNDQQITHTFHFSGMILSSNLWILSTPNDFILPEKLQSVLNHFTKFYISQHNGRKLKFLPQYSTGELEMCCTKQKYILQVSTYQMSILLLFNESNQWTVEQIQNKTQLNLEFLLSCFHHLLQLKILICDTIINKSSTLRLSEDFRSHKIRMNLNIPLKSIEQKEIEDTHRTIDEDRKILIEATIVRIMKTRQTLKHSLLMQEVIQQLNSRFKPEIPLIQKCIDRLIEKEYLERDLKEKDLLRYLA